MENRIRVVVDTNLWISLLIGGKLGSLLEILVEPDLELIGTQPLLQEIENVARRPKFRKYFPESKVKALIELLLSIMTNVELNEITPRCREPKDDYLLELAVTSHAIYLVSGDSDLLDMKEIEGCKIMSVSQFVIEMKDFKS